MPFRRASYHSILHLSARVVATVVALPLATPYPALGRSEFSFPVNSELPKSTVPSWLLTADEYLAQYNRQSDGGWLMREVAEPDGSVALDSVPVVLPMSEVYRQVTFKDENPSG